jgi:hypothetical protein
MKRIQTHIQVLDCLIRGFPFYYTKQIDFAVVYSVIDTQCDVIMWEEQKSDRPRFCSSHIMTSYCVSITEQTTAKSYLFVKQTLAGGHVVSRNPKVVY